MKITNKHGVPETLVALASRDTYTKGRADFSVTEIISPPRIQRLRQRHHEQMESDVADMLWQLLGSCLHVVAERSEVPNHINEERIFAQVDGVTLSGAIDIQEITPAGVVITDYKFTGSWSLRNAKPEWEAQQNIYAWLVSTVKGQKVAGIRICALIRDWSRREALNKPDYPQAPIQVIELPMWPLEKTGAYIRERIEMHRMAKVAADWEDALPLCTNEERWMRETQYAVRREGRKTAIRVLDNEEDAKKLAEQEKGFVEVRPGEPIRCTGDFCGVAQWCDQFKKEQQQ